MCLKVSLELQVLSRVRERRVQKLGQWACKMGRAKGLKLKSLVAFLLPCFGAGSSGKLQKISLTKGLLCLSHLLPKGGFAAASKTLESRAAPTMGLIVRAHRLSEPAQGGKH